MLAQLDTKTVYTFMDSMVTLKEYVRRAKDLGYASLGIMDRNVLYAAYSFMELCYGEGVQPIVGCELDWTLPETEATIKTQCIALTSQGYRNLLKLSTAKMLGENDFSVIKKDLTDIAVVIPYFEGIEDLSLDIEYYIGVSSDTVAETFNRPILPMHTVRLFDKGQLESLQVLHAIRDNCSLNQVGQLDAGQVLLSAEELRQRFSSRFPQALTNLSSLVQGISYQIDRELKLPRFNHQRPAVEELKEKVEKGMAAKQLHDPIYQERVEKELSIIHRMGFDDYFLIVWDLLRFGRSQGYYMGMGRGSAVGSLVAYVLDITGIDPVKHHLLFERFLNEERYSMPDIDIDIPDIYRSDFIRYVRNRYGATHAAQIVTYSTFGARQAIRDVFKRFGTPEYELSNLTKKISAREGLAAAYHRNTAFRQLIQSKIEYQKAFAIAQQIEGQPRQTSIHAAGVVISDEELTKTIPLKKGEDMLVTQYDAPSVEANGLLKMDFLGLRNLTFVQKMAELVGKKYQQAIDIAAIPLEDKATLDLFASGRTKGIFQFEQAGAIHLLKRVQPTSFEEIVATTSLNRPGASDYSDNFVRRKHGQERVDLLDDSIADILRPTYGIMLYQEQVMQIAQVYAGFTLGKADLLRRAMSKKNIQEMQDMEAEFLQGAAKKGHPSAKAKEIFTMMAKFAGYGFNRSHAYAYSALAFQLAYFKAHYPDVFFSVMLNDSSSSYIEDALRFDFQLAKPTINSISYEDRFDNNDIHLGLKTVKGIAKDLAHWVVEHQPYRSIEDFLRRLPKTYHKKAVLTPLIQLGLFDEMEQNRKKIIENLDNLFLFVTQIGSLWEQATFAWEAAEDYTDSEKFMMEQDLIGVGLSPHPLTLIGSESIVPFTPLADLVADSSATILVQVEKVHVIRTKKTGEQMAFLQVTDARQTISVTLFPSVYQRYASMLAVGILVYMTGKVQDRDARIQLIMEHLEIASREKCWILLENKENDTILAEVLKKHKGSIPVVLHYRDSNQTIRLDKYGIMKTPQLEEALKNIAVQTIFR